MMGLIARTEAELLAVSEDDPAMRAMVTAKARGCLVNVNDAEAILVGSGLPDQLAGAVSENERLRAELKQTATERDNWKRWCLKREADVARLLDQWGR